MGQIQPLHTDEYPDLWGLTANEVTNHESTATLSIQEYHLGRKQASETEARSIDSVAFYPLHLLQNNLTPFDYSIDTDNSIPKAFVSVFQNSITLYQLYTFYVYAISELGSARGESILQAQSKYLDEWISSKQSGAISAHFDDISNTAKQHAQNLALGYEDIAFEIPVENSIAKTFLLSNRESPLYIGTDKQSNPCKTDFLGMDLALAEHLGQAKDRGLEVYAHFFSVVSVNA